MDKEFLNLINYMSERIKNILLKYHGEEIQEIRMRIEKPLCITIKGKEFYLGEQGKITFVKSNYFIVKKEDLEETFRNITEFSFHSYHRELKEGFITTSGGNRVGICGTAVLSENGIETIKNISSLNFRIAREYIGSADLLYKEIFTDKLSGTLIIGPPNSAKTTILRDLCRQLGNKLTISIIDERGEIAACYHGVPQNDVGSFSDILNLYPKRQGIMSALKVLSPKVIAVDEIGSSDECNALSESMNSGVKIIATAHAGSIDELMGRKHIWNLCLEGIFEKIVLLGTDKNLGKIIKICEVKNLVQDNRNFCNNTFRSVNRNANFKTLSEKSYNT